MAPALAVVCTFVARQAELTPRFALAMAVLAGRAGNPVGVLNVIPSSDSAAIGQELSAHEKVANITFNGATCVGKILTSQCANTMNRMPLELGDNARFIVFDDSDLDAAVAGAMIAKYRNIGQTRVGSNWIYVQAGGHDIFADKLKVAVAGLKVGDGFADGVTTGLLINDAAVGKVEDHGTGNGYGRDQHSAYLNRSSPVWWREAVWPGPRRVKVRRRRLS